MPVEIELKLQLDPRHVARLRSHALFKRATHATSRKLYSIYYDTPDLRLWNSGVALRLRRSGKRWIQTIKSEGGVSAGLHRRNEYEIEVATRSPDFSAIGADLAGYFADPRLRARLTPVMITGFTRMSCLLKPAAGSTIEASIDRGTITSRNKSERICEVELEVKTGPPWHAYQAALQLLEAAPLLVEDRSKAERGIALFLGDPGAPRKAPPSIIHAEMNAGDAFKTLAHSCLAHYVANQCGMLADADPEFLHQARVALRRLRSVFNTFAPLVPAARLQSAVAETRWLAHELGRTRDLDVFAAETLAAVAARHRDNPGIAALVQSARRLRQAANRETRRAATSPRAQGLLLSLGSWLSAETGTATRADVPTPAAGDAPSRMLQDPVSGFARTVLDAAYERVSKRGRNIRILAPRPLHRLRIAVKKLRYAGDFFGPLYPRKRTKPYLARLAELQEVLGLINDASATSQRLAALDVSGTVPRAALDLVVGRSARIRATQISRLARAWQGYKRAKVFW